MKNFYLIIAFTFVNIFSITATHSDKTPHPSNDTEDTGINLTNVFYTNDANDLVFIDFENIGSELIQVNVIQNEKVVMVEDVAELPQNLIYELELSLFDSGDYILELVTDQNIKIRTEITIQ